MKKLGIIIVMVVLTASSAWAFRGGCGLGQGAGVNSHIASTLNLTEDQKSLIQAKQEVFFGDINPLRDKLFSKKMELRDLWSKASPDQSAIAEKQQEIQLIQNEIQEKMTQHQLECRRFLTAEQQEKLGTVMAGQGRWSRAGMRGSRGWQMNSK
jgi:Spy/CpxP family protein refolding chaperone